MLEEKQNQRIKFKEIMEKKREEDRISTLSDCLLIEILSRLPSTKEAIRTGALSKRWEHLWTLVPTLIFTPPNQFLQNPNSSSSFALSVDKTLSQCRQLKLKKFQVHTFYEIQLELLFRDWIRFAVSCNVEELNLEFSKEKGEFVLDQFLFISSCVTDLRLAECKLNPAGAVSWENLRSLFLSGVDSDEDLLVKIVSRSPLLETLELEYCKWPDILSESADESESDTSLSLTQCRRLKKLKKFKLFTRFDIQSHPQINNLIRYVMSCNVTELNLLFWCIHGVDFKIDQMFFTSSCFAELRLDGCMFNPVRAISWKSLRFLCLSEYFDLDEDLIEKILSGSPVLETLELRDCYGYRCLDITSKSVKNLVLRGYKVPYLKSVIEINAPHILSLTIESGTFWCKLLLLNVSSLVKAYLNYTCREIEHRNEPPTKREQKILKRFIMKLRHVKEVKLGFLCAEVLSFLEAKGFISPSNVKLT